MPTAQSLPSMQSVSACLQTLHRLLVRARWMAGEDVPREQLYDVLDQIEILPSLLVDPTEANLEQFRLIANDLGSDASEKVT